MASAIRIIWKCTKPNNVQQQRFYEQLMTQAAQANGMDTAVIRQGVMIDRCVHIGGQYVKTVPHITGDIVDSKKNVGFALHYNVDNTGTQPIAATTSAPNPELWELKHKEGKGFILVSGSDEEVRDI
ncbi:hypothetical protein H0H87_003419 [Tephrocybe sp. NHM501043]|nr:hypothetical protein H0H87_005504 [Tephrocybe sp. NHM501043]KAG6843536.1 hypothetical protein H0H87_003419 [Tephrocybe sp. NHM501043]